MRKMYSKNQIKAIIQEAINNGGITLYQDTDISSAVSFPEIENLAFDTQYCSIRKTKDKELYLVFNFSIENTGESSKSLANTVYLNVSLDEELAKQIYDVNGSSVAEQVVSEAGITGVNGFTDTGYPTAGYIVAKVFSVLHSTTVNRMRIQLRDGGTIPAGSTWNFTLRFFLNV